MRTLNIAYWICTGLLAAFMRASPQPLIVAA